jgi:iron(III) transport system substrate-binding protein
MNFFEKRVWAGILTFCAAAAFFTGCGSEKETENASGKLSGSITVYTSQPEQDVQKLIEKFNEQQPDIKVNVFRSGTEEVVSKVLAEKETGNVQADVLLVADAATFESLKGKELLMSYKSPELKGIHKDFYDADHTYTGTKIISTGIVYNKNLIKTAPTSYKDLIKAEFKNNVIMPSPLYSGAAAYNLSVLTRTNGIGWEYYQALKDNGAKVDKGNGTVQKAVVDGQVATGILVDYMALRSKAKGAPVDFVYPSEGSLMVTEPVGILKSTKHEALAKAFVDFILSETGQKVTAEIGYTPIKSGVQPPIGFKSVDEIKNMTYDLTTIVKARQDDKQKFSSIFN